MNGSRNAPSPGAPGPARVTWRGHLAAAGALAAVLAAMAAALPPVFDTPMFDDWSFIPITMDFARTGTLRYLECNDPVLVSHVLMGGAWLRLTGPAVMNLRLLDLALALAGAIAAFGLLAELGLRWGQSLAGALVLMVNPFMVYCSYSWMSDVPYVAVGLLATWAYVAGLRRGWPLMAVGGALSLVAILNRQTAMVIPFSVIVYLAWRGRRRPGAGAARWLSAVLPIVLGFVGLKIAEGIPDFQKHGLPMPSLAKQYSAAPEALVIGLGYLAFSLLPLAAGYGGAMLRALRRSPGRWLLATACGALAVAGLAAPAPGLGVSPMERFALTALAARASFPLRGMADGFLVGYGGPIVPEPARNALGGLALLWLAVMLGVAVDRLASWPPFRRVRPVPRGRRFGLWIGVPALGVAGVLLGKMAAWQNVAAVLLRAAYRRGFGRGQGFHYWYDMTGPVSRQAAIALAVLLGVAVSELLWQAARRRAALLGREPGRLCLLWGFAEFAAMAAVVGPPGALVALVALKLLLWRWQRVPTIEAGPAPAPTLEPRAAVVMLSAAISGLFYVFVLSRWAVYSRHFLPVVFPAALVVLGVAGRARLSWAPFGLVAALFAAYSLAMVDIYVSRIGATARVRDELIAEGVPAKEIRAGLELDGLHWRRYSLDHPEEGKERLAEGWPTRLVPVLRDTYVITGGLRGWYINLSGYEVLRREAFRPRLWPYERPIYVLRLPDRKE